MRFEGVLSAWHPDAGYGAIRPLQGGEEVFVNLAAFPTDGDGPRLDERLSFEIVSGRDGRKQAVRVSRIRHDGSAGSWQSAASRAMSGGAARRAAQRKRRLTWVVGAVIMGVLVACGLHWAQGAHRSAEVAAEAGR